MQTTRLAPFLLLILLLTTPVPPVLAFEEINKSYFGGLALDGYDVVGYFTQSEAVKRCQGHTTFQRRQPDGELPGR